MALQISTIRPLPLSAPALKDEIGDENGDAIDDKTGDKTGDETGADTGADCKKAKKGHTNPSYGSIKPCTWCLQHGLTTTL